MEKLHGYLNSMLYAMLCFNFIRLLSSSLLSLGSHLEMRSYFEPLPKLTRSLVLKDCTYRINNQIGLKSWIMIPWYHRLLFWCHEFVIFAIIFKKQKHYAHWHSPAQKANDNPGHQHSDKEALIIHTLHYKSRKLPTRSNASGLQFLHMQVFAFALTQ